MATLSISGDTLTVQLENISANASSNPNDLLSNSYFDSIDGVGNRPTLAYLGAAGDIRLGDKK